MASFKNIPITQLTKPNMKNLYDFMIMKYSFEPITDKLVRSMGFDLSFLDKIEPTDNDFEEHKESAKAFLIKMINENKHIGVKYDA